MFLTECFSNIKKKTNLLLIVSVIQREREREREISIGIRWNKTKTLITLLLNVASFGANQFVVHVIST